MGRSAGLLAISEIVAAHYERVYRFAYRLSGSGPDAEDITQDTFTNAQEKLSQLREPERVGGWLLSIARNVFLQAYRKQHRAVELPLESLGELCADLEESSALSSVDTEELQLALQELPEEFRSPLVLFYFDDCSYREIAEQMQVPMGTVMSRLARAKEHLRKRLASEANARQPIPVKLPE